MATTTYGSHTSNRMDRATQRVANGSAPVAATRTPKVKGVKRHAGGAKPVQRRGQSGGILGK